MRDNRDTACMEHVHSLGSISHLSRMIAGGPPSASPCLYLYLEMNSASGKSWASTFRPSLGAVLSTVKIMVFSLIQYSSEL